jgi:hypothetical protein
MSKHKAILSHLANVEHILWSDGYAPTPEEVRDLKFALFILWKITLKMDGTLPLNDEIVINSSKLALS